MMLLLRVGICKLGSIFLFNGFHNAAFFPRRNR